jgi:hypothetical protein
MSQPRRIAADLALLTRRAQHPIVALGWSVLLLVVVVPLATWRCQAGRR